MPFRKTFLGAVCAAFIVSSASAQSGTEPPIIKVGIIGLDTSHAIAFSQTLNKGPKKQEDAPKFAGVRVVAAYPQGSKDIQSSVKRVPEYTAKVVALGVEIVASIEALLSKVDAVLLESNDGRVHFEQLQPVLKARKPVFIDKPIAASLADVVRILDSVREAGVPSFCSSSLRFGVGTQSVKRGALGRVITAETFSPVHLEPTHSDLFWYGVHGCESLLTVMGPECQSAKCSAGEDGLVEVVGTWKDGRRGVFRQENGRERKGYGGFAKGENGDAPVGAYDGYDVLLAEVVAMFRTGKVPVSQVETLELYAFMEAAAESRRRGGEEVSLGEVLEKAKLSASQSR